jgi:hypothetical protein
MRLISTQMTAVAELCAKRILGDIRNFSAAHPIKKLLGVWHSGMVRNVTGLWGSDSGQQVKEADTGLCTLDVHVHSNNQPDADIRAQLWLFLYNLYLGCFTSSTLFATQPTGN